MKELVITNEGLRFKEGEFVCKAHIDGEWVNKEKKLYSISCGLIVGKDKDGKEAIFVTKRDDEKATIKRAFLNFKFNDKGVAYTSYAKDENGKFYDRVILKGLHADKEKPIVIKGTDGKDHTYFALKLSREIVDSKVKASDGKEITVHNCVLVEPKPATEKAKTSAPKKDVKKKEEDLDLPF